MCANVNVIIYGVSSLWTFFFEDFKTFKCYLCALRKLWSNLTHILWHAHISSEKCCKKLTFLILKAELKTISVWYFSVWSITSYWILKKFWAKGISHENIVFRWPLTIRIWFTLSFISKILASINYTLIPTMNYFVSTNVSSFIGLFNVFSNCQFWSLLLN